MVYNAKRPLISMIVHTFNHERFIKQALCAALSQDYDPLEIIIADDYSTDRTREIVAGIVASYHGPHRIKLAYMPTNGGTFANFQNAVQQAEGQLVLGGAGDDVALPKRASIMAYHWRNTGAVAMHSSYNIIDEQGGCLASNIRPTASHVPIWKYFTEINKNREFINGATSAFTRDFLRSLPQTDRRIFHEDMLLTFILHAEGRKLHFVDNPTVQYRVHGLSYSNRTFTRESVKGSIAEQRGLAKYAVDGLAYMRYITDEWWPSRMRADTIKKKIDWVEIDRQVRALHRTYVLSEGTLSSRLKVTLASRSLTELRGAIVRLPGIYPLAFAKTLRNILAR